MTTFAPRGQLSIPAGRRAPFRLPLTGTVARPAAGRPGALAAPTPARPGLLALLADVLAKPAVTASPVGAAWTSTTEAVRADALHDAVYRNDDGGSGDDGGWDWD